MQTLLKSYTQLWVNQITYGFRSVSGPSRTNSRHKKYAQQPLLYYRYYQMKKKIDFKNADLTFPINIPLKQRYQYRPKKQFFKATSLNDYINTEIMSGNELLLYLEQVDNLRPQEILDSLLRLHKINEGKFNLLEHPWIKNSLDKILEQQYVLTKQQFVQLITIYGNYGIETPEVWKNFEERTIKFLPNMKSRLFGDLIRLFLEKNERASDEFKKELSLILPVHMKKMSPIAIAKAIEMVYKNNLMTEYLFFDHFHFILRNRFLWFVMGRACPQILKLLREADFENCEFLWPIVYTTLDQQSERIPYDQCGPIRDELAKIAEKWPSHSQYRCLYITKKLGVRATWEQTLGGEARKLNLIEIVRNDILYYKEKQKLLRNQTQQSV